jgi:hypothetical protein
MLKFKTMNEDFERDFLKDSVYLQEKTFELEQETRSLLEDIREAAKIFVVKKKTPEHEPDILPF